MSIESKVKAKDSHRHSKTFLIGKGGACIMPMLVAKTSTDFSLLA